MRVRTRAILEMMRALPASRNSRPTAMGIAAAIFMAKPIIIIDIIFFILPRPTKETHSYYNMLDSPKDGKKWKGYKFIFVSVSQVPSLTGERGITPCVPLV